MVLPAAGDRLLTAYDPLDPDVRYAVSAVDPAEGADPDARGCRHPPPGRPPDAPPGIRDRLRGPGDPREGADLSGRLHVRRPAPGGRSTPIEAVEHYFADGASSPRPRPRVILEAPPDKLEAALPDFDRFAREIAGRAGTAAAPRPWVGAAARRGWPRSATRRWAPRPRPAPADLVKATVQILMVATIGGQEQAYGWGSGTILSPNGLILTNAHVAKPTAAGRGIFEADPTPAVDPEDLVVAIVEAEDQPAVPKYRATVRRPTAISTRRSSGSIATWPGAHSPAPASRCRVPIGDSTRCTPAMP